MTKIENDAKKAAPRRMYQVAVSFNGLDKGGVFALDADDKWAAPYVAAGYLHELGDEEAPDAGQESKG